MAPSSNPVKTLSPKFMAHVVLRTAQKDAMSKYYQTFLGAHVVWENEVLCFLTYDEEHHRIALLNNPSLEPKSKKAVGLEHIAFTYETLSDLLTAYKQRKAAGITPALCVNHGPTTSMYYADPDGNHLETQVDNFETAQQATDFMNGPEFAENPYGADFDPEDLIRRFESGESDEQLKKFRNVGPRGPDSVPLI
ncbi:Glyoxalase/Bleomycin resistance protein/Dihydroxybiphenyl dioxygenase [Xylariaceae sp. FL0255]|nr:Glyoxalase/Bleomycin resistance protein/Dihydroxybiphenyl dioxygenase [Xylariaceae sp. FL0255]